MQRKRGLLVTIFTNGILIDEFLADYLVEHFPFSVEITIYGSTEKTFESITGVEGSFQQCMRGIKLLNERKIPMKLKTMVFSLNKHELDDMKDFAGELEVDFCFDPILNYRLDGNSKPAKYRLSPEEVVELDKKDHERVKSFKDMIERFSGKTNKPEYIYKCGAGVSSFHIDPYGKLSPCIMSRDQNYDLLRGNFAQGWSKFIPEVVNQKTTKITKCTDCKIIGICSQCPGFSKMENGDQEGIVDYICRIAHKKVESFRD